MGYRYSELLPKLAEELARQGYEKARLVIRSNQLRRGLRRVHNDDGSWSLLVPHYWAVYLHDGRGPVTPKTATYLVWFRNPKDDPRLTGGRSPERLSQARRLSASQFKYWAEKNRQIIKRYRRATGRRILTASDYEAMKLPMIVVKMSPRSGGLVPGQKFFSNEADGGMSGFPEEAGQLAVRRTSEHVRRELSKAGFLNKKRTVVVSL